MACTPENRNSPCGLLCLCSEPRCDHQLCARKHCRLCDLPFDIEDRLKPDGCLKTFCSCFLGESKILVGPQYLIAIYCMPIVYAVPCTRSNGSGSSSINSWSSGSSYSLPQVYPEKIVAQDDKTLPSGTGKSFVPESDKTRNQNETPSEDLLSAERIHTMLSSTLQSSLNEKSEHEPFSAIPNVLYDFNSPVSNRINLDTIYTSPEPNQSDYLPVPSLNTTFNVDRVSENLNYPKCTEPLYAWETVNENPQDLIQDGMKNILGGNTSSEPSQSDNLPVPPLNTTFNVDRVPENVSYDNCTKPLYIWETVNENPQDPIQHGIENVLGGNTSPESRQIDSSSNSLFQNNFQ